MDKKVYNNRNNTETNKIQETDDKHSVGTRITKYWKGIPYIGTVIGNNGQYYKIKYDDDGEEELNHGEVKKYMDKNRGKGQMTIEIGLRMRLRILIRYWKH
jgi:hypothetical protein